MRKHSILKLGLIFTLILPTALVVAALVTYIVTAMGADGGVFHRIANLFIFLAGAIGVVLLPAGVVMVIVGLIQKLVARDLPRP